jgi:hypothetical protein
MTGVVQYEKILSDALGSTYRPQFQHAMGSLALAAALREGLSEIASAVSDAGGVAVSDGQQVRVTVSGVPQIGIVRVKGSQVCIDVIGG